MSDFETVIQSHCLRLFKLCLFAKNPENRDLVMNRRFLGRFNLEATWMEETLDGAGARKNSKWFPSREGVSAVKLFSSVTYDLLHVVRGFEHYNLMATKGDFIKDSKQVLDELYDSLVLISKYLIKKAKTMCIHKDIPELDREEFVDLQSDLFLVKDRTLRHINNPGKTLVYLATEFLSLKPELKMFNKLSALKKSEYKEYIPTTVSEEKLRLLLVRFHNLQSLYDTYLSESDIEEADTRLRQLRGHISFVFHMLKSATEFSHYYERHIIPRRSSMFFKSLLPIESDRFLEITICFFLSHFVDYFDSAITLCREVIDNYAELDERYIPIPEYRGFHVRPSTLVAKIVNYYGGKVRVVFGSSQYDPAIPLELFRVNEEINAIKRVELMRLIDSEGLSDYSLTDLLKLLAEQGNLVIYNSDWKKIDHQPGESNQEYLKRAIAFLLASGKIDIKMDLDIRLIGDKRALDDIEILAKNGYGEDKYGNNIPLPKELDYLKR